MQLLFGRTSFGTYQEWAQAHPLENARFRRCVQVASAWIFARHIQGSFRLPWILAGLVDLRRTRDEREATAQQVWNLSAEMVDDWFGLLLIEALDGWEDLVGYIVQAFLWQWAWSVWCSVCQVEFCHGRNRTRATAAMH